MFLKSPPRCRRHWSVLLVALLLTMTGAVSAAGIVKTAYEVILKTSSKPLSTKEAKKYRILAKRTITVEKVRENGKTVYWLKVGQFETFKEARAVLRKLAKPYPDARAIRIKVSAGSVKRSDLKATRLTDRQRREWLEGGRKALINNDLASAEAYFSRLIEVAKGTRESRQARELLGLVYERMGKTDKAREVYTTFLRWYPKGEDSERVRQRLNTMLEARAADRKPLPKSSPRERKFRYYGSLSQFLTRDVSFVDGVNSGTSFLLISDVDMTGQYSDQRFDIRSQLDLNHRRVFEGTSTSSQDRLRVNALYIDIQDRKLRGSVTIGRQRHSSGGVLGRFDGLLVGYQENNDWHVNAVIGMPADLNDSTDSDRFLYGISADGGTFAERWDVNGYAIRQTADGIVDRAAVGGEVRYVYGQQSHLALIDYDLSYLTINDALFDAHWFGRDGTNLSASIAYRAAPLLVTENALIGQGEVSISQLLQRFSEDDIRQLARDRTARLRSLSLGASRLFRERWQVSADFNMSNVSEMPASGGVAAIPSSGTQYLYSVQTTVSNLFVRNDISTLSLRYNDLPASRTLSLDVNSRYPVDYRLRAEPRLGIDYRSTDNSFDTFTLRPTFRADYSWKRDVSFDAELGVIWSNELGNGGGSSTDIAFEIGYRVDF